MALGFPLQAKDQGQFQEGNFGTSLYTVICQSRGIWKTWSFLPKQDFLVFLGCPVQDYFHGRYILCKVQVSLFVGVSAQSSPDRYEVMRMTFQEMGKKAKQMWSSIQFLLKKRSKLSYRPVMKDHNDV